MQLKEEIKRNQGFGRQEAWQEANVVIAQLQKQLADSKQDLRMANLARDQLEEDMKQAFMRGVCALNIEVRFCLRLTLARQTLKDRDEDCPVVV